MTRRSARTAAKAGTRAAAPAEGQGLALHEAATRAQGLLRERARLLREVQKKKQQLEKARQHAARDAEAALSKMAPLVQRHDALIRQLAALFAELLAPGRISARARKEVARIRRSLELQGVLSPPDEAAEPDASDPSAPEPEPPWSQPHRPPKASSSEHGSAPEVAGAEQVGQGRRSLRELFRSLAKAVHPDQARHDTERERRTAVMKEVTRAYEEGDLARLLELESSWQSEQASSDDADSIARCRELARVNRELLDQVRELTRQIRDSKREARDASMGLAPDELAAQASRELDELQEICQFIQKFRDGKLTLAELARGPHSLLGDDELALLEQLFLDDFTPPAPRRGRSPR